MNIGRLSTSFALQQAQGWLQSNQSKLNKLQEKTSTGQNVNRPSDDPLALANLLNVNQGINHNEQYIKNIDVGLSELQSTDSAVGQVVDIINRASELATQGANVTTGINGMTSISKEIDLLTNQLVQLGNSSINGVYLFAGVKTSAAPFVRTADVVTYSGTLSTEAYQREIDIDNTTTTTLNTPGDRLFGDSTSGLLKVMIDLKNNLAAGSTTDTRARLDELKTQLESTLSIQSEVGANINRLTLTKDRTNNSQDSFAQLYAGIQNVDMAKTITDLRFQEQIQQTSLSVLGRVLPKSLLDFI
ncbi:MAG: flagellar hook-associated protein FlgL [Vampirovibrio sp.]|nr:flagellar hook-associated protein FlgL [Vampirovibrio sp.]